MVVVLAFMLFLSLIKEVDYSMKLKTQAIDLGLAQHNPKTGIFEWKTNVVINVERK